MMRSLMTAAAAISLTLESFDASASEPADPLLQRGESVRYRCGGGEQIDATYYGLKDRSLSFVRLTLPDGRQLTLPQLSSASGARYSADQDTTWWTKGDGGFLQERDSRGDWRVTLDACDAER